MNLLPLIPAPWRSLLDDKTLHTLTTIGDFLDDENFQPQTGLIFRALALTDPMAVRCIILGQDPYPTPRVPTGLAFDVGAETIIPASLRNIFLIPTNPVSTL
jgi:uracil-DNA glycosylase